MKTFNILVGVPGVGKSTYINEHKKDSDLVISYEEIERSISPSSFSTTNTSKITREFLNQIKESVSYENVNTIWIDSRNVNLKSREYIYNMIKKSSTDTKVNIIFFHKPLEESIKLNNSRTTQEGRVHEDILTQMYSNLELFQIGVDCDSADLVVGDYSLYNPELENLHLPQKNFYNIDSVKVHIDKILDFIEGDEFLTNEDKAILSQVALFHDLGKSVAKFNLTKTRNFYEDEIIEKYGSYERYHGHENVSAIYFAIYNKQNKVDNYDLILYLIQNHHHEIPETAPENIKKYMKLFKKYNDESKNPWLRERENK